MPHLFVSAGDISGDQHAARLVRHLRGLVPDLTAEGLGGPALKAAGVPLREDLVGRAVMGIGPALAVLPRYLGLLRRVAGILDARPPDAVVVVDYPGLNLFVARLARARRLPVVYFVAPQLWAWAPWRVRRFARVVDEALVIFPFEEAFFRQAGIEAHYIGHPLLDGLPEGDIVDPSITGRPAPVALLPGSRRREVREHMPLMLDAARHLAARHGELTFHTAHVSHDARQAMANMAAERGVPLAIHGDAVHAVMASCRCAVVGSGTATLETAMLGTPMVVLYRITPAEDWLRRLLLVPPFVGQVNLVAGREVAPELLLTRPEPTLLVEALEPLLEDGPAWHDQRKGLAEVRARSAGRGAVARAAERLAARLAAGDGHHGLLS